MAIESMEFFNLIMSFIFLAGLILFILLMLRMMKWFDLILHSRVGTVSKTALSSFYEKMKAPFHSETIYDMIYNIINLLIFFVILYPFISIIFMWVGLLSQSDYIEYLVEDSLPNVIFTIIILFAIKGFAILFDMLFAASKVTEGIE